MAKHLSNNSMHPVHGCPDRKVAVLVGKWAIGASGAVGAQTRGTGLQLTRTGAGAYTIQLRHAGANARANAILHCDVNVYVNDADPTNDTDGHYVKLLAISDTNGTVTFQAQDEAGVVREAPSGAVISVCMLVALSGVTR